MMHDLSDAERAERVIAAEIRRRKCPKCDRPLTGALVATELRGEFVLFSFRCSRCGLHRAARERLTPLLKAELLGLERSQPVYRGEITPDELVDVHIALQKWNGDLRSLFK